MSFTHSDNILNATIPKGAHSATMSILVCSDNTQYLTATGGLKKEVSGSGQVKDLGSVALPTSASEDLKFSLKFEYEVGGKRKASHELQTGGPYKVGNLNMYMVVCENGDDLDYNDCIVSFKWKS